MENTDNKTIIRRHIEQVENTGDVSNIRKFISEDYTEVYEGGSDREKMMKDRQGREWDL